MKYHWQIISLLLAFVVLVLSFHLLFQRVDEPMPTLSQGEATIETIMTRSSVRQYTTERVSDELVETILRAGMASPTAGNRQPWEFYVLRDTTIIRQLNTVTKFADPMRQQAQLVIVVCGVPSEAFPIEPRYWVQDVSAATENILLAAHALGLGAVWSGVYPCEDRVATLRELLDVPERLVPFNMVFMGHSNAEAVIKDKWKPEKIHYVTGN